MTLDKNKTVWQRLALEVKAILPEADDAEVTRLTAGLFPYVLAEKKESEVVKKTYRHRVEHI